MPVDSSQLQADLHRWSETVVRKAVPEALHLMRGDHRVPRDRGELVRSLRAGRVAPTGTGAMGEVLAPVIQAVTTDRGARPHVIYPKRAGGLLVFYWPKAGGVVAFRHVNHPGNPARPWWQQVTSDAFRQAIRDAAASTPL